ANVVRREAPQCILLSSDLAEVQSIRVEVIDLSESPFLDEATQLEYCGMVVQQMTYHQDAAGSLPITAPRHPLCAFQGQRLFHEDVFPSIQGTHGQTVMGLSGRGDHHRLDVIRLEERIELCGCLHSGSNRGGSCAGGLGRIADELQSPEFVKIADKVLSPVPT